MKKILLIAFFMFNIYNLSAQGCSDAGICSVGNSFSADVKTYKNSLEVATVFGAGEFDVTYISPFVTYTRNFTEKFSLSTKVTFSSASGSFGRNTAIGDVFLVGNYKFNSKTDSKWSSTIGFKLPTNNANQKINGFSIPLDYQSSLGTFDLILGLNLNFKKWDFNTAIQVPVINNNKNSYIAGFSGTNIFPSTNLFERKSDLLFRTTYTTQTSNKKFTFKPNFLFLYHLGNDTFENIFGQREAIIGSKGLTVNGNLITAYKLGNNSSLELSLATPFVVRKVRPDGLTRKFTAGLSYKISF